MSLAYYFAIIEVDGSPGRDDERERVAFEAALQRGYERSNRVGYSELRVHLFRNLDADNLQLLEALLESLGVKS